MSNNNNVVIVITLATHDNNNQPILFSNICETSSTWLIKNLSISLFRDWSISECRVVLTTNLDSANSAIPPLPNVYKYRSGKNPYLTIEDEIRIYAGYVDNYNRLPDLLGEIPVDIDDEIKADPNKPLVPVFWGFIDKIDFDGSNRGNGNQIILSCRDRMKVLNDTTLINVPSIASNFQGGQISTTVGGIAEVLSDICYGVMGATSNGPALNLNTVCWKPFITPSNLNFKFNLSEQARLKLIIRKLKNRDVFLLDEKYKSNTRPDGTIADPVKRNNYRNDRDEILNRPDEFYAERAQYYNTAVNRDLQDAISAIISREPNLSRLDQEYTRNFIEELREEFNTFKNLLQQQYFKELEYHNIFDDLTFSEQLENKITLKDFNTEERKIKSIEHSKDPSLFIRRSCFKVMNEKTYPRFHCWVNRPELVKKNGTAQVQILDKTPLGLIKWVASMCPEPIDFFASHVNGDFCFVPRVPDTTGLSDERRYYRTYFFKGWPNNSPRPCDEQLIINMRTSSTNIATLNNITVINNNSMSGNGISVLKGITNRVSYNDYSLQDRTPSPPERNINLYTAENNTKSSEAVNILTATEGIQNFNKNFNTIIIDIIGDPTFYPGEVIRIYNTFLHDKHHLTIKNNELRAKVKNDLIRKYTELENPIFLDQQQLEDEITQVIESGMSETNITNLQLPQYIVRTVQHKISSNNGFITSLQCSLSV